MEQLIEVSGIPIYVERKNIKNMYIRILPPEGRVKITVPTRMTDKEIRKFAFSRIDWIKKNKLNFANKPCEITRQFVSGESHYLWGKRYQLEVMRSGVKKSVEILDDKIILQVPEGSTLEQRESVMEKWYREQLKMAIPTALDKCSRIVGKSPDEWRIKNMKTRWGTCNINKKRIWLNLQLAKKSPECLEYVITHELVHLYVRNHNAEFRDYMNRFYPDWKGIKKKLNEQVSN